MKGNGESLPRAWPVRLLVIGLSVALHAALIVWLMGSRFSHPVVQHPDTVAVELVQLPPEPEPEPKPEPAPVPDPEPPKPVVRKPPPRAPFPPKSSGPPVHSSGPPVHSFGANQEWAAPAPAPVENPVAARGRPVPSAYADTVKNRVIANLKRPAGSVYKPPPGYKGDPNDFKRQCYIPYEITVDAGGRMLSYEIDRCGDELLDAAAEQAVRSAGPFPPPPNQGAGSYIIYGTAIFIN